MITSKDELYCLLSSDLSKYNFEKNLNAKQFYRTKLYVMLHYGFEHLGLVDDEDVYHLFNRSISLSELYNNVLKDYTKKMNKQNNAIDTVASKIAELENAIDVINKFIKEYKNGSIHSNM